MSDYSVTLSTTEPNNYVGLIKLRQGDVASQSIQATITANGQLFKFDRLSVFFNAVLPNGNVIRDKVTGVDYVNSKINYIVADSFLQEVAQVTAWFSFENDEKIIDSTKNFQYSVIAGWKECIPQGNYIYELSEIQREIEEIIGNKDFTSLISKIDSLSTEQEYLNNKQIYLNSKIDSLGQQKADKSEIDAKLSQISSVPETFANLAALKSTYPNGKTGLFVTADTGHKYIWANGTWTDAGVYQSVGIADGAVTTEKLADGAVTSDKIHNVSIGKLTDGYSDLMKTTKIFGSDSTMDTFGDTVRFTKNSGDKGFVVPVTMPDGGVLTRTIKVYFEFSKTSVDGDNPMSPINEVYLSGTGNLIFPGVFESTSPSDGVTESVASFEIKAEQFANAGLAEKTEFNLNVIFHGGPGTILVKNWSVNEGGPNGIHYIQDDSVTEAKLSKDISLRKFSTNFAQPFKYDNSQFSLTQVKDGAVFQKLTAGDTAIKLPVSVYGSDVGKDLYCQMDIIGGNVKTPWDIYLHDADDVITFKLFATVLPDSINAKRVKFKIPSKDISTNFYIAIWTHDAAGQNGSISNISVNGLPYGDISDAIVNSEFVTNLEERVGASLDDAKSRNPISVSGLTAIMAEAPLSESDMMLKQVTIYSPVAMPIFKLGIGQLDQYNLLINETDITNKVGELHKGLNVIDLAENDIRFGKGMSLILHSSAIVPLQGDTGDGCFVQDNTHAVTNPYVGNAFYATKYRAPFSFVCVKQSRIQKNAARIDGLAQNKSDESMPITLTAPDGNSYRLSVTNNGNLQAISLMPHNAVFMGNSLTIETGGLGMAASDQYHDYYYLTSQKLKSVNHDIVISPRRSAYNWEAGVCKSTTATTMSEKRQAWWDETGKTYFSADTDLAIVQLLDNVNTDDRKASLEADAETLISNIKLQSPGARVMWIAGWFAADIDMQKIKNACANAGAEFVDVSGRTSDMTAALGQTRTGTDGTTWPITIPGEAAHPGDIGMKFIADTLLSALDL